MGLSKSFTVVLEHDKKKQKNIERLRATNKDTENSAGQMAKILF